MPTHPEMLVELALSDGPLVASPTYTVLTRRARPRGRAFGSQRGRSYEFDRMESGTADFILDNLDSALNVENTSSPYFPLKHTRQIRGRATWAGTTYPIYHGLTQGYPQSYLASGHDALVRVQAVDRFLALTLGKLTPGATTLTAELLASTPGTPETTTVASTALPMPQVPPFDITVDAEDMRVTAILSPTTYTAERGANDTLAVNHAAAAPVTTNVVNFAAAQSGTRVTQVLTQMGIPAGLMSIDTGQTAITDSEDLAGTSPLEHINVIAETELGRFFVNRSGIYTFSERHQELFDYLTASPIGTFVDEASQVAVANRIPYMLRGEISPTEEKLYNRVRITIPSGRVIDVKNQPSIDDHIERVYEKSLPYAEENQASDAAAFLLNRLSSTQLRIPALEVQGAKDPTLLWPILLGMELGQRFSFRYQPKGGGTAITKSVVLDGIRHKVAPKQHTVELQLTPANTNNYWLLGHAGLSELGSTTRLAY